jgi:hypothetical protein
VRLRMDQLWGKLLVGVLAGLFASIAGNVQAEVIVATDAAQVIEVLPAVAGGRGDERRLRQLLAARPGDARLAVLLSRRQLDRARTAGDPRFCCCGRRYSSSCTSSTRPGPRCSRCWCAPTAPACPKPG